MTTYSQAPLVQRYAKAVVAGLVSAGGLGAALATQDLGTTEGLVGAAFVVFNVFGVAYTTNVRTKAR